MAEFNVLGKIIMGAILMILGVTMITVIADMSYKQTTPTAINAEVHALTGYAGGQRTVNETAIYTITNYPTNWKVADCPITNFVLKNVSGAALTLTTDYTFTASTGQYQMVNSSTVRASNLGFTTNNTYADYSYCANDYLNSSFGRSVLNMVGGLIAIMLLVAAAGIFYQVYQETQK